MDGTAGEQGVLSFRLQAYPCLVQLTVINNNNLEPICQRFFSKIQYIVELFL